MLMIQDYSLNLLYEQQAKQLKRLLEWETSVMKDLILSTGKRLDGLLTTS